MHLHAIIKFKEEFESSLIYNVHLSNEKRKQAFPPYDRGGKEAEHVH